MQTPLRLVSGFHPVFAVRELKECVHLEAAAAAQQVLHGHLPGTDVAGAAYRKCRARQAFAARQRAPRLKHAKIPRAEIGPAVSDALLSLVHPMRVEKAVGVDQKVRRLVAKLVCDLEHFQLEFIVEHGVEDLQPDAHRARFDCLTNEPGDASQPFDDGFHLRCARGAGQRGAEVLLQRHGPLRRPMPLPDLEQGSCREGVLIGAPDLLSRHREMVLARRRHQRVRVSRSAQRFGEEPEITRERFVPSPPLPGDCPSFLAVRTRDALHGHVRFFDGPVLHALQARFVLRDDRLEHHETQTGLCVLLHLVGGQGELAGCFAKRVLDL